MSKPPLAAVLLAAIGAAQIGFARVGGMTPWKGGGFGMFATLDHGAYRGVDVVVEAADRSEALKIAPSLEEAAARAATYPADWLLRRLAEGIVARERRYDRPVTRVKLRVWRTEFDSVTLHASERICVISSTTFVSFETALRLTAIALLLRPMGPWFVRPMVLGAAALALIYPRVLRMSGLWGAVAFLIALRIVDDWPLADNHIYLLAYWALAIAFSLRDANPARRLAWNSRWLLGLAFGFAVLWKAVLSPDFLDGRFFRVRS